VTDSVLTVHGLAVALPKDADRTLAVSNVTFGVAAGELLCLVGESGSGKSIVAHTIMGLLPTGIRATAGQVRLAGEDLLHATPPRVRQLRGESMAMIFQEPGTALNPVMTCGGQIDELLVQHRRLPARQRRTSVLDMLTRVRFSRPEHAYAAYPHQLSGGQRQRIMVAMALILKPPLLIADEPTTALDVTTQAEILTLIRELQRENGTAVLFITHDLGVVSEIADRVAVLNAGELVESGPVNEVLARPRHPYTRMLLGALPSLTPRKPSGADAARPTPVWLRTRKLTKVFDSGGWLRRGRRVTAVDTVDLDVRKGETLAIVGESGSGKTTLARLIARLIEPSSGEIAWDGADVLRLPRAISSQLRRKVQVVFQDPYRSLNPRRTVGAAIAEGPMNFGVRPALAFRRAAELMSLVQLPPEALSRYPHEFSGGQRQRVCLARALALEPELLIADEAVSALDVTIQAQVLALLEDVQRRLHLTVVFVTHDIRVAARIADRVVVMRAGRVVERGTASDVFEHPRDDYTRRLLEAAPGRGFAFGGRGGPGVG
jgi:peptide/nickel transport system ATP-binding protein